MEKGDLKRKSFKVRRLFKQDVNVIMDSFKYYDRLHFNPVNEEFVSNILLSGEFWGVFDEGKMIAATWLFEGGKAFFDTFNAKWEITDLLNDDLKNYLVCGYVWQQEDYLDQGIYKMMCRLWAMQGEKMGKKNLVHYTCAHCPCDFNALFEAGFQMVGLRGLDNIVPHYIFTAPISFNKAPIYSTEKVEHVPASDTKSVSKFMENGYCGVHLDQENNFYMIKKGE